MKEMTVGEFKTKFSEVIEQVKTGEEIAVTYGKKKQIVGYFLPQLPKLTPVRKLGILEGKASFAFGPDAHMTISDF
jgi:hypothetical protein